MYQWLISKYPYRGLFGWATFCVWAFVIAEILWHLSTFVRSHDWLEIPLIIPYAPIALILDPHDALLHHRSIFFLALANWFGIFLLGSVFCFRKISAIAAGGSALALILAISSIRMIYHYITVLNVPIE